MSDDPGVQLRRAIRLKDRNAVEMLLGKYGDLLDNIDPQNGWSNLHYAVSVDSRDIATDLLKQIFARTSPKSRDSCYHQITDVDEIKLTFKKETVIHMACQCNSFNVLPLLLDYFNVCLDQRDQDGNAASHICCIKGHPKCLKILLENGAYANLQNNSGDTPLHLAMEFANQNCLRLLVEYNADEKLLNNSGWTPLDLAFDDQIIQLFKNFKLEKSLPTQQHIIQTAPLSYHTPPIQSLPFTPTFTGPRSSRESSKTSGSNNNFVNTASAASAVPLPNAAASASASYLLSSPSSKISLPTIQSRKFSINSAISDDFDPSLGPDSIVNPLRNTKINTPITLEFPNSISSMNSPVVPMPTQNNARRASVTASPRRDKSIIRTKSDTLNSEQHSQQQPQQQRRMSSMSSRTFRKPPPLLTTSSTNITPSINTPINPFATPITTSPDDNGSNTDNDSSSLRSRSRSTSINRGGGSALLDQLSLNSNGSSLNKMESFNLNLSPIEDTKRSILSIPILSSRNKKG